MKSLPFHRKRDSEATVILYLMLLPAEVVYYRF